MTPREAFKVGFISRCIEDGLATPEQIKRAADETVEKLAGFFDAASNMAQSVGGKAFNIGVPLALAAPPIIGGIGGAALAKATDVSDDDVQGIKDREVINAYKLETQKLQRAKALRDSRLAKNKPGRIYL